MVTLASFAFEVGFAASSTPSTATPTYTDISAYVVAGRGISITRGRANEFDASAQPGQCGLTLKNTDGRFTMGNAASPYAPLQIRRPLRVRVTYGGTTYPIFAGFVDSFDNGRDGVSGRAIVSASDRLARAERTKLQSAIATEILFDEPSFLYPLTDPAGSTSISEIAGTQQGMTADAVDWFGGAAPTDLYEFGVGIAPGPDPGTVLALTNGSSLDGWLFASYTFQRAMWPGATSGLTIGGFVRWGNPRTYSVAFGASGEGAPGAWSWDEVNVGVYDDGTPFAYVVVDDYSYEVDINGPDAISATEWTHLAIRLTVGTGHTDVDLLVNGTVAISDSYASETLPASDQVFVGGNATGGFWDGQLSHIAFFPVALSDARIAEHIAALTGWVEASTLRFERICRNAGLPASHYDTDGLSTADVTGQPTAGKALAEALDDIAEAESGAIYCDHAGVLRFAASTIRYGTTVGLTLDARRAGQTLADAVFTTDDSTLLNDLTVTRQGGSAQRAKDDTSIASYDIHDESITLIVTTDDKAAQAAAWRIADRKTPAPRISAVTIDVVGFANSGGNVANLLNADTGTRLRIMGLPLDVFATSTLDQFIEGVSHTIGKDQWTIRFTTSPIGAAENVLILDDTTRGKLDTGVLAY